jgi:hypothetical protein
VLVEKEGNLVSSLPGDDQISWETLQAWWNQGNGIVFWCAHGNEEGACRDIWYQDPNGNGLPEQMETTEPMFIDTQFPKLVTEDFPPVVFEASCLNGNPQAHGNLAHTLLQRVTVGNVASSRITIGTVGETQGSTPWRLSPFDPGAFSLGVYFTHSLAVSRKPLGEALRAARTTLTFGAQPWTFKTQLEFNLYGDPCLVLPACSDDSQCNDSNPCSGEESCQDGKCQAGIAVVCPQPDTPLDECSQIQCLPDDGCVTVFKEDFTRCAASDPCASAGFCEQGRCKVAPKICPPTGNPCTLSSCHEVTGNCLSHPLPDGIPCAVLGTEGACAAGECVLPRPEPDLLPDAQPDVQPEVGAAETVEAPPPQPRGCAAGAAGTIPSLALLLLAALALARAGHARVHAGGRSDV